MNREEVRKLLDYYAGYSSINQRYHQAMINRWGNRDLWTKVLLAIVTVLSFTLTMVDAQHTLLWWANFSFSLLSILAAVSLTYFGFDVNERSHAESFARWTYLQQDIQTSLARLRLAKGNEVSFIAERLPEVVAKVSEIEKDEMPVDPALMLLCQYDENESVWGEGVRTHEQVLEEVAKRVASAASDTSNLTTTQ